MCYIEPDGCRLLSRNGKTFARFETLARQVATELDVSEAILDGEVITADETGRPQFYDLLRRARTPAYVAFDPTVPTCGNYRSASAGSGCKRSCRRVLRSLPGRYQ